MVREVLRSLGERGLVTTMPGRGTYVREVRPSDGMEAREALARRGALTAHHLIDARRALESEAAALASVAPDDAELGLLEDLVVALESATGFAVTAELDLTFHGLVTSMSRNPVLEMTFSSVRPLTYALIVRSHADSRVHQTSLPYHRKVFDAIAARDAAGARRAMEQHFTSGQRHYGRDLDVSLTEALRVRPEDRSDVADLLRRARSSVSLGDARTTRRRETLLPDT
jgi:GntR family transcriptional repressor for pyruvate dehydrogenase complex